MKKSVYSRYPFFPDDEPSNTIASHEIVQQAISGEIKALSEFTELTCPKP